MSLVRWDYVVLGSIQHHAGNAVAIYDLYVNISNEPLMRLWIELAYQTHWHVFLLDGQDKQHGFGSLLILFASTAC